MPKGLASAAITCSTDSGTPWQDFAPRQCSGQKRKADEIRLYGIERRHRRRHRLNGKRKGGNDLQGGGRSRRVENQAGRKHEQGERGQVDQLEALLHIAGCEIRDYRQQRERWNLSRVGSTLGDVVVDDHGHVRRAVPAQAAVDIDPSMSPDDECEHRERGHHERRVLRRSTRQHARHSRMRSISGNYAPAVFGCSGHNWQYVGDYEKLGLFYLGKQFDLEKQTVSTISSFMTLAIC